MAHRNKIRARIQRRQQQRQKVIIIVLLSVAAVAIIAGLIFAIQKGLISIPGVAGTTPKPEDIITPVSRVYPNAKANSMGDPNAPVKVEELSNFKCSHCLEFTETIEPSIVDKYIATGKVYWTYTSFVWTDEMRTAADAAYCAMDQNKFWEYRDILFANANNSKVGVFNDAALTIFAEQVQLDMGQFRQCFQSHKYLQRVKDDEKSIEAEGVQGTPTFILDGKLYASDEIQAAIESALKTKQ